MPYRVGKKEVFGLGERGSGFKARSMDGYQDFQKIRARCLKDKTIFEDDEFSANETSVGNVEGAPFKWKRPHVYRKMLNYDYVKPVTPGKKPQFIVGGAERFDVKQGCLGNCWLLAAVADLTLNEENFKMVVPEDNTFSTKEYTGAFHFRFWQFGKWIDIVVDDRLPCDAEGQLAFMSSGTKNEFWSPLLEKAYAKLNGSYQVLDGGLTFEALEDFTGGFTEVILMKRLKSMNLIKGPDGFFDLLKNAFERRTFMGTSVKENPDVVEDILENGLVRGHAYSITDIRSVNVDVDGECGEVRLLRIRNPWGTSDEWKGDWCDGHEIWESVTEEDRAELEINFEADGEFWMSYEDFMDNFERIEVCHLNPHSESEFMGEESKAKWISHSKSGNWTRGATAGGSYKYKSTFANNPQFVLDIGEPGEDHNTFIVCLLKKERKIEVAESEDDVEDVSLNVFQLEDDSPKPLDLDFFEDEANEPLPQMKPSTGLREITIRYVVPSGRYCIIPSSVKPNQEGKFLLRIFTEGRSTVELYDEDVDIIEIDEVEVKDDSPEELQKLEKARKFYDLVCGEHEEVNWWDLKLILDKSFHDEFRYEGFGFSEDVCRSMVALMDADRSGQLGFYEFTNLWDQVMFWKKIFNQYDHDRSHTLGTLKTNELRVALKAGGYAVNKDILEDIVLRYGDKNGEIFLDKFIIAALKLKTMIELFKRREDPEGNRASFNMTEWLDDTLYS